MLALSSIDTRSKAKKVSGDMSIKKNDDTDRSTAGQTRSTRGRMAMPPEIEENLKRAYQAALSEAVPDRFTELLAKLREKEGKT